MNVRRAAWLAATLVLAIAWVLLLRPASLGGPVTYALVSGQSMEPSLHHGDLVLARRRESYDRGDVIVYRIPEGDLGAGRLVVHRVVGGSARHGYRTRGDNRDREDFWRPRPTDVAGDLWVHIPFVGRLLSFLRTPLGLGLLAGAAATGLVGRREQP